jgi:hypothetical protein
MKSRDEISVDQQATFGESVADLETSDEIETDLEQWGVVEAEQEQETRYEVEAASEFGRDDRREVTRQCQTKQGTLFVDVDDDQVTLDGQEAAGQGVYEQ